MLTLNTADLIASKILNEGEKKALNPLCVAVLDAGGNLLVVKRDERSSISRPEIAIGKAAGCLGLGVGGRKLAEMSSERPTFFAALNPILRYGCVPVAGGVLVRTDEGQILGAVGVTGDTSDNDEACALVAIKDADLVADNGA